MSIVDGKGLIVWEGGFFEPGSDLLHRVQWAFAQIRAAGGDIVLNEAGRPFGVPGDMQVRDASQTASGFSTVWFQWGRYLRGETPSAANPNSGALASEHTQGIAIDCDAKDVFTTTLRARFFAQVGMRQTISSESWHWAIRGNPTVDLTSTAATTATKLNTTPATPKPEEDFIMTQGAYFRLADGQPALGSLVAGSILYQSEPGEPLQPVTEVEWFGAQANKNAYTDIGTQRMQALLNVVGLYDVDKNGRRVPAQPGRASRNGFSVYLP